MFVDDGPQLRVSLWRIRHRPTTVLLMSNEHRIASVSRLNRGALWSSVACGAMLVACLITSLPTALGLLIVTGVAAVVQRAAAEIILASRD